MIHTDVGTASRTFINSEIPEPCPVYMSTVWGVCRQILATGRITSSVHIVGELLSAHKQYDLLFISSNM